ncbi:MAG TPA: hypothetical protein VF553_14455 [Pyrinomonadaceae bacterium]
MKNARYYTVHIDLRHLPEDHIATLHAGGKKYELRPHTPETLAAAESKSGVLSTKQASTVTHYATDVAFPETRLMSYWVYDNPPGGEWDARTVAHFGLYSPDFDHPEETQLATTWDDVAVSILFHHPSLFNLRTDQNDPSQNIGPMIQQIIRNSPYLNDFVNALVNQCVGTSLPWTMEEVKDYEGNPVRFASGPNAGQIRHQMVYTADTLQAARRPLKYIIQAVKDTEALENWNWRVSPGLLSVPVTSPATSEETAAPSEADAGPTFNMALASVGSQAGFEAALASQTSTDRTFTIDVTNKFARYVAMYVQFLDSSNNLINPDLEFLYQTKTVPDDLLNPPAKPSPVSQDIKDFFRQLPQAIELSDKAVLEQPSASSLPSMIGAAVSAVSDTIDKTVDTYLCYQNGDSYDLYRVAPWGYKPPSIDPLYDVINALYSGTSPKGVLQTSATRYIGYMSSIPLIMAVPTGWAHNSYNIPMPPGAAKARILAGGGLGGYGSWLFSSNQDEAAKEAVISFMVGGLLTSVVNIVIPTILLPTGGDEGGIVERQIQKLLTGEAAQQLFRDLLPICLSVLGIGQIITSVAIGGTANSLLTTLTGAILGTILQSKSIAIVLAADEAANIAEDEIPLVGQIAQGINIAATLAQMAETTIEELIAPMVILNTVTETFDCQLTVKHDARDRSGFPATARWYDVKLSYNDGTTTRDSGLQPFQQNGQVQTTPLSVLIRNLPATGFFKISIGFYADDTNVNADMADTANPVGVGSSPELDASSVAAQTPTIIIKEEIPRLDKTTTYTQSRKLAYDAQTGHHIWQGDAAYPTATVSDLDPSSENNDRLSSLTGISFSQLTGLLGYGWEAGGQDVPIFDSNNPSEISSNIHTAQSISSTSDPEQGLKFTPAGFRDEVLVCYELLPPRAPGAPSGVGVDEPVWQQLGFTRPPYNFFLQPGTPYTVADQTFAPQYVRSISLDDSGALDLNQTTSWGRFPTAVTDVAIHPGGKLVGLYATGDAVRLYIIELPQSPLPDDQSPWPLHLASGKGSRINLLQNGLAVGCTGDGAILVLDDVAGVVQAFDVHGNPLVSYFKPDGGAQSNQMPLRQQQGTAHYLDMAIEHRGFIYVLLYLEPTSGTRVQPADYLLDIYKPDGSFLVSATRTEPMSAAKLTVDLFRNLYTLNYEQFNGPVMNNAQVGRVEPTVSELIPSIPDGWAVPGDGNES